MVLFSTEPVDLNEVELCCKAEEVIVGRFLTDELLLLPPMAPLP